MEKKELIKELNKQFKELGCVKGSNNLWLFEMTEIALVFKIRTSSWSKHYYVDTGVIFKKLYPDMDISEFRLNDSHVGHDLSQFLLKLNIPARSVENLLSYEDLPDEVMRNVSQLFELINKKVIKYFENYNDYAYLVENFKDQIAFKPFFVYFKPSEFYVDFFKRQLEDRSPTISEG